MKRCVKTIRPLAVARVVGGKHATTAERKRKTNKGKNLETLTKETIEKINKFFSNNWAEYRKKVESTPLKTFKDYLPIGEGK
jgi:hypothetical protein